MKINTIEEFLSDTDEEKIEGQELTSQINEEEVQNKESDEEDLEVEPINDEEREIVIDDTLQETFTALSEGLKEKFDIDFDIPNFKSIDDFINLFEAVTDFVNEQKWETITSTSKEIQLITKIAEKGGSLREIGELYNKKEDVVSFKIEDDKSQEELIRKFYEQELKWTNSKIDKYINSLKADEELATEAEQIKSRYQEKFEKEIEQKAAEELKKLQEQEELKQKQIVAFAKTLEKNKIPVKTSSTVVDYVYKEKHKLENGETLTDFDLAIIEFKKNPENLFELVQFLINKDKYLDLKFASRTNIKTEKTFKEIVKNKINNKTGNSIGAGEKNSKTALPLFKIPGL